MYSLQSFLADGLVNTVVSPYMQSQGYSEQDISNAWGAYKSGDYSSFSLSNGSSDVGTLDWLRRMAKNDPEYAEKLFDYMVDQANVGSARDYDKLVRQNSYQWMFEDLKKAGLNPYLALNSLGGSSGANIQAQGNTYGAAKATSSKEIGYLKTILQFVGNLISSAGSLTKLVSFSGKI